MNINLNVNNLNFDNCKNLFKMLEKQECKKNSLVTIDINYKELELLIKSYVKKNVDIDMDLLKYDLDINIGKNNIHIKVEYPKDDEKEYLLFTKELKNNLGNQIINNKSEINSKIMLRTMFINALYFNVCNSNLKIAYDIDNLNELENIKLQI